MRESTHQATRRTNQPIHYDPPCVQKTVLTYSNSIQIYYRSSWIYMDLHGKSEGLHPTNISKFPTLISTWPRQEKFPVGVLQVASCVQFAGCNGCLCRRPDQTVGNAEASNKQQSA